MPLPTDFPTYGARILQMGSPKGLDVWNLQVKLIGWGSGVDNDGIGNFMDPVRLTAEFDATTRDAVMRFQKAHKLPVTGIVDALVFWTIDREAALHPVLIRDLRCPCVDKKNDGKILCRCTKHPDDGKAGVCTGFGKERFGGKYITELRKLPEGTVLSAEKLDVYEKREYDGMDKTVLWAVRAVMCRARTAADDPSTALQPISITAGYRCWWDNYHQTDDLRWHHRELTFHFGKAIEFIHPDPHTKTGEVPCAECGRIRDIALKKCGFQLRWQGTRRVSVAEGTTKARPPATPFAVHVDTVRLHERKADGELDYEDKIVKEVFVKTDADAAMPLYQGNLVGVSFPLVLAAGVEDAWPELNLQTALDAATTGAKMLKIRSALDPKFAFSEQFFRNNETGPGGWFPVGVSRMWHGGIHLNAPDPSRDTPIHAIADGEIVGCLQGESEEQPDGSRNFVLLRHVVKVKGDWENKEFYSLYMHLDGEAAKADALVRWRRELFQRSKTHVEALVPAPIFEIKQVDGKDRLFPKPGLAAGEMREVTGAEVEAKTKDDSLPDGWKVVQLVTPANHYFFTQREGKTMGERRDAMAGAVVAGTVIGLEKPIKVSAGEVLGKIAKAATQDPAKKLGKFFHLETFAESALPVTGFTSVDATDVAKLADRKDVITKLSSDGVKLLPIPGGTVLTELEMKSIFANPPYYSGMRSVELKMPSAWSVDWKPALKAPKSLGFLKDPEASGTAWNKYNWWEGVKAGNGKLPASPAALYHYHPMALILQIAYSM